MIPICLRLTGFLSYRQPVEVDFTGFDLACISGSNGAGKSSLLDAITWALFGQARKRDDSLINSACEAAEVVFEFTYEGNLYRVQRSKPRNKTALLEFSVCREPGASGGNGSRDWKTLTEKSLRETEARIRQTLRLDYETFINASFFLQGKADQFAQQAPGDRKRILSSILGLEIWETYRERAVERRKTIEGQVDNLDGQMLEINAELAEEPARKVRLAELQAGLQSLSTGRAAQESALESLRHSAAVLAEQGKRVEDLRARLDSAVKAYEADVQRLRSRQAEGEEYRREVEHAEQIEAAYRGWQAARAELERWEAVAARFHEQEQRRSEPLVQIEAERARLTQERDSLQAQAEAVAEAQERVAGLGSQRAELEAAVEGAEARVQRRAELEVALRELHQQQAEARAENPRLKAEMDDLKARIDQLSEASGAVCPVCGQPLAPAEREALVQELTAQGRLMGERFRQNQALLKDFDKRVREMEGQIKELSQAEADLRALSRRLDQLNTYLELARRQQEDWEAAGAPRLAELGAALREETFAPEARARLAEVDAGLKAIGYDAAAHDGVRRAELAGRASEEALRQLEKARAALAPLEREIAGLSAAVAAQEEDIARQRTVAGEAAAAYAEESARMPDLEQAERELFSLREQENRLRMEVGAARQKVDVLDRQRARQAELAARREEFTRQIAQLKTLERAFGKDGVPALLIEQALPEIESQANQVLERLSGGSMSVRFATQKDYKDHAREDKKETLDILISDGAGTRDYEMFSGGESFRVNFAIRLALSRVLAQRAGARLQTLVVDEGFGSQDAEGRQRLIEAINLVQTEFSKILVITHLEELKDAFPTRIEVEKTPEGSSVRIA